MNINNVLNIDRNKLINKTISELCVLYKLESFFVEGSDLAGVEATDESIQWYDICSSQLLSCQVVIFSNTFPRCLQLFRKLISISEHDKHYHYNHEYVKAFLYFTWDSFQPQWAIFSRVSSGKGSFFRSELENPRVIHPNCITALSFICDTGPKAYRNK